MMRPHDAEYASHVRSQNRTSTGSLDPVAYRGAVDLVLRVLDRLATVAPERKQMDQCAGHLASALDALRGIDDLPEDVAAPAHALGNPRFQPAERGLTPVFAVEIEDEAQISGHVRFSPRFGGTAAVHGGAISLFFDDALGMIANRDVRGGVARTAFLRVDYRSLARLDTDLSCRTWIAGIEGRKRFIRGEIRDAETMIAEAEGLWISPRPGATS
ncbi:hypothetical protein GCM10023350_28670 [Nocardioides endophyticus]|uniref:Acyl-coenzyme A thioesterase THEM4 n=1 Tax=Nocardioides endophyticus TaxID=1353775 RepID=A0ABP8YZU4_9ACTN